MEGLRAKVTCQDHTSSKRGNLMGQRSRNLGSAVGKAWYREHGQAYLAILQVLFQTTLDLLSSNLPLNKMPLRIWAALGTTWKLEKC